MTVRRNYTCKTHDSFVNILTDHLWEMQVPPGPAWGLEILCKLYTKQGCNVFGSSKQQEEAKAMTK
jgi:hypothetical protein